ncbi:hypothetical protein [Pseudonocardia nigra]|uniref:hypothetical protein n=1 Tax=Pseudonocardia nigra TaxID=1921578 RepID=UPI001C5DC6CF|nr:hypothetical protein [Pseudonocardia nigra]
MDIDPARDPRVPGITADTTLGEIASLVADRDTPRLRERPVIETVEDRIRSDLAIAADARARQLPYLATAATGAAGYAAWGCAELATAVGSPGAHTVIVTGTWAATALSLPVLRFIYRHRIPEAWRRRWWLSGVAAAGWVDVAAATSPATWVMTGALLGGAAALSARWAAEHEIPNPSAMRQVVLPAPPPPPAIDTSRAALLEQAWYDRVADGPRPILSGAWLTSRTELPNATMWMVQTDPGSFTFDEMFGKRPKIAAALGIGVARSSWSATAAATTTQRTTRAVLG